MDVCRVRLFILCVLLSLLNSKFAEAGDLGYRLKGEQCALGEEKGFNPGFVGECGDLAKQNFSRVFLSKQSLRGADLKKSRWNDSRVVGVDLSFVTAAESRWQGSRLEDVILHSSNFHQVQAAGISWVRSHGERASFIQANLKEAIFRSVDLPHVRFRGADLSSSDFEQARLYAADFRAVRAEGSHFKKASLQQARFDGAFLLDADFSDADLRGADLAEAVLAGATLTGAIFNTETRLPFSRDEAKRRGMVEQP